MADYYVRSTDGSDSDNGSTWALAKATLAGAFAVASAGDTVWVSQSHAESAASAKTFTSPGTAASPVRVLCGNDAAEPPTTLATTATITTTGANAMDFAGYAYCYGITFNCGTGTSNANINFISQSPWWWRFEQCALKILQTNASGRLLVGTNANVDEQLFELISSSVEFSNVNQGFNPRCPIVWQGGSITGATLPTNLFIPANGGVQGWVNARGVDLSLLASGNNLVLSSNSAFASFRFTNCKLGSSVVLANGQPAGQGGVDVDVVNCDSADTNYRYYKRRYQGEITQESTIVRTGGATDGTTPISRKMVTSAGSKLYSPLVSDPIIVWNESTGSSLTATVEVVTDNVTLTDAEAWVEVEYLGTSGFPLSLFAHDRVASLLGTPANQTSSSETWTTTGLTTPVKQALAVSFTPQEKGPVAIRVHLAKASTTMYFCPKATIA